MSDLVLHDLWGSNNSMKVRIALNYKGIPYRTEEVEGMNPAARQKLVEISGQPLAPVMTDGDRVLFDSSAIVRYLEANFPDTPRLFSSDRATMREIEKLENWAKLDLGSTLGTVFGELIKTFEGGAPDLELCGQAAAKMRALTGEIESRLEQHAFMIGDEMTAADATAAPIVFWAMPTDEIVEKMPPAAFFVQNYQLGEGRERTRDWCMRVMKYAL